MPRGWRLSVLDDAIRTVMSASPAWLREKVLGRLSGYPDAARCWLFPVSAGSYGKVRIPRSSGMNATVATHRVVWLALRGPRILVTGSREWSNQAAIDYALALAFAGEDTVIVHGDCPTGACAGRPRLAFR